MIQNQFAVSQAFGATCGATTKTSRREDTAMVLMQLKLGERGCADKCLQNVHCSPGE